ncbi:hypothetical protein EDB85DRAFT_1566170 [Lactarius pseudohatsudake]|nr:hypothetical protein EDB85DRAFT_1566170 [Lactarius pseudohatsudake]
MRIVARIWVHYRVSPLLPAPPGAPCLRNPVWSHAAFQNVTLPPLPLRNQSVRTSPCQRDRERDHDPVDIVSANSSSSSSPPRPSQRSTRKTKKRRGLGQLMAYVLILRFPPGVRKSDHTRRRLRLRATDPVLAARALVGRGRSRRLKRWW